MPDTNPELRIPSVRISPSNEEVLAQLGPLADLAANKWRAGFVSVGPRGHISTESGNGDWQEGWHLLEAFAAGLRVQV
jgi:predicted alpha/beta hydrolase family esterase